jgi:hypothetical protein
VGNIIVRILSIIGPVAFAATGFTAAPAEAATPPSANAGGKAILLLPLSLLKVDDLDFGAIVPSSVSGTVTINATTGARTFAGGVTGVPSADGNRALFVGAGTPSQQVIMVVNAPAQLANANGDKIDVLGLTMDGSAVRTIDTNRAFFVGVGGSLDIKANQPDGDYSAAFDVTAYYQ